MDDKKIERVKMACEIAKIVIDTALTVVEITNDKEFNATAKAYIIKHVTDAAKFNINILNNQPIVSAEFKKGGLTGNGKENFSIIPTNGEEYVMPIKQMFDMSKVSSKLEKINKDLNNE